MNETVPYRRGRPRLLRFLARLYGHFPGLDPGRDAPDRKEHQVVSDKPGYKTVADFDSEKAVDQTALISDLSHQLEEGRHEIETLKGANREWHLQVLRLEGARDALRELLLDFIRK